MLSTLVALLPILLHQGPGTGAPTPQLVRFEPGGAAPSSFAGLRAAFRAGNADYDLDWCAACQQVAAADSPRVLFVQHGSANATVGDARTELGVGDLVLLQSGIAFTADAPLDLLAFTVPEPWPAGNPAVIRPDHDPKLSDQPGGCATEAAAYRRMALTWEDKNGPYHCRALNAHRVNVLDSFTHYHPVQGGFDEFYLVQGALPGARVLTCARLPDILDGSRLDAESARGLLQTVEVRIGDLLYLPRGVVHRGLGGVLAQVITVPGFKPGAEIAVDRELVTLRERLHLTADDVPAHVDGVPFVSVRATDGRLCVEVDGAPFTEYRWRDEHRPHFFPLLAPGGVAVTRSYPDAKQAGETTDHPHHQSLWFAHGDVDGVDFWSGKDAFQVEREPEAMRSGPGWCTFAMRTEWLVRGGKDAPPAWLTDRRIFRIAATSSERTIDLDLELQAPKDRPVKFGDTKEGSFALRLADPLRGEGPKEPGRLSDSEGRAGKDAWGKHADWVHATGVIDGHPVGVALFDHPQNLRHPTTWHARTYGLLAANPFGLHDFEGAAKGAGDYTIPAGGTLRLRYRVLIYAGEPDLDRVSRCNTDLRSR
jgi:hypothetical protein